MEKPCERVLVVLRDYPEREALRAALETQGCWVDMPADALAALKLTGAGAVYQLVIMELILGEISGLALYLAAREKNSAVKAIGLNNGTRTLRDVASRFGIDLILEWPVTAAALSRAARELLR